METLPQTNLEQGIETMQTLTKMNLEECFNQLQSLSCRLNTERFKAKNEQKITISQFNELWNYELSLQSQANILAIRLAEIELDEVLSSDTSMTVILAAIENAQNAVNHFEKINQVFEALADVMSVFGTITKALSKHSLLKFEKVDELEVNGFRKITKQEVKECLTSLREVIQILHEQRFSAKENELITIEKFNQLGDYELRLLGLSHILEIKLKDMVFDTLSVPITLVDMVFSEINKAQDILLNSEETEDVSGILDNVILFLQELLNFFPNNFALSLFKNFKTEAFSFAGTEMFSGGGGRTASRTESSSHKIKKVELEKCLAWLKQLISILHKKRFKAKDEGKITIDEFNQYGKYELALGSLANILATQIINMKLDELISDSSATRIIAATNKAQEAVQRLEETNRTFQVLAKIIDLFGAIIKAIQAPSSITIKGILDGIDAL